MMAIIYLVGIVGALFAVTGLIASHDAKVKDGVVAVWRPLLEQQIAATNTAVDAANQNLATVHAISAQAQLCSEGVQRIADAGDHAKATADALLKAKQGQIIDLERDRLKYAAFAARRTDEGRTCEQKLDEVRDTLSGIGAIRMRDHPGNNASGEGNGTATATGQGAGAGTVLKVGPN